MRTASETEGRHAETGLETRQNRRGNLVGTRMKPVRNKKTFKSGWETWEDSGLYVNGNEFGKSSK